MKLNEYAQAVHENAVAHGWYDDGNLAMAPCVWAPDTPGLWQWTLIE